MNEGVGPHRSQARRMIEFARTRVSLKVEYGEPMHVEAFRSWVQQYLCTFLESRGVATPEPPPMRAANDL